VRNISDTIARLAALRAKGTYRTPRDGAPDHLKFLTGFGSNPGALKSAYHLPKDLPEGAPLVVVLHGCTQNPSGYDRHSGWSELSNEMGFALLYPEQQRANNPNLCFNWFQPADTRRGSGEALSIHQMIETMVLTHGLDAKRVFITGLSAGGAMAAAMLASYPDVFAGGAIVAGLPYGSATTIPEAFDRMRGHGGPSQQDLQRLLRHASTHAGPWPKISVWQGASDQTVAPSNAQAVAAQWQHVHGLSATPSFSETAGKLTRQVWCGDTGEALIEINIIAGMGHGTPVGADGLGAAGPFTLDVGISSTRAIAQFWGIMGRDRIPTDLRTAAPAGTQPRSLPESQTVEQSEDKLPELKKARGSEHAAGPNALKVKTIIEDALRAAGLMR
jgi:poly(hydroxyalkanoate) depolymerase family esterase